jgi:hypothetical protein
MGKPLRRRRISSSGVCQTCNLHDRVVCKLQIRVAIRPRTDSGTHVYFGRVTALQTAADHAGVVGDAAVQARHRTVVVGRWGCGSIARKRTSWWRHPVRSDRLASTPGESDS